MGATRRRSALGVAVGGVLAGHWLTYVLVDPDVHQRTTDLARTGHAYLGLANDLGLIVALVALSAVFLGRLTHREVTTPSLRALSARLSAFQIVAFVSMELLERLSAGAPLAGVLHHGLLPIGVVVQAGIAGLGALVIRWLLGAADRVASTTDAAPGRPDRATAVIVLPAFHAPSRSLRSTAGIRGPPLLASPR